MRLGFILVLCGGAALAGTACRSSRSDSGFDASVTTTSANVEAPPTIIVNPPPQPAPTVNITLQAPAVGSASSSGEAVPASPAYQAPATSTAYAPGQTSSGGGAQNASAGASSGGGAQNAPAGAAAAATNHGNGTLGWGVNTGTGYGDGGVNSTGYDTRGTSDYGGGTMTDGG